MTTEENQQLVELFIDCGAGDHMEAWFGLQAQYGPTLNRPSGLKGRDHVSNLRPRRNSREISRPQVSPTVKGPVRVLAGLFNVPRKSRYQTYCIYLKCVMRINTIIGRRVRPGVSL